MNNPNVIAKEFERSFKKKLKRFYCYELDLLDYGERAFLDCFSRVDIWGKFTEGEMPYGRGG